ncbi:MAG: PAS domain-containing methyl-accepting chemotaxis protein [Desulfuromonadaceae bacterium]|nr:PAS domain-containing methyl-accepting chemotaxis protein [Desulfuromonadaceae bacterium]
MKLTTKFIMINVVLVTVAITVAAFLMSSPIMMAAVAAVFSFLGGLLAKQLIDPLICELTGITDKMHLQAKDMEKSQDFLKQIVNGSTIPTFVIDHEHVVTHWNLACEIITGLDAKAVVGTRESWRAFYESKRPVMADVIINSSLNNDLDKFYQGKYLPSELIEGAFEAEGFFPQLGKNGRWLFFTAAPMKDPNGNLLGVIETLQDITKQKDMEQTIAQTIDQQSEFTIQLSSSVVEISSTMEEFTSTASQIARHSQGVAERADNTLEDTKTGSAEVENLACKVNNININIQANITEIVELGRKSKEINKVMEIINNIANQTKLIAFNAALEAASAGESGKRFGVVAVEIRRLADSVVDSTTEIEGKIREILDSVNRLVMSSEKSFQLIKEGQECASRTVAMLKESVNGVEETTNAARQISLSTQQQQIASSQVLMALKDIELGVRHSTEISKQLHTLIIKDRNKSNNTQQPQG